MLFFRQVIPIFFYVVNLIANNYLISDQRLACFYYDINNNDNNDGIFNVGLSYVFARGSVNEDIYITGFFVDGFFKPIQIKGAQGYLGQKIIANYDNNYSLAEYFCYLGIKNAFPESYQNKKLVHLGVKSSFLAISNAPIIFKHLDNNKHIDRMVIFGDSLSDQGNLKQYLRFFPRSPYFAGRFSNHMIWIDYIQQQTHLAILNYAVAGSVSSMSAHQSFREKSWLAKSKKIATNLITGNLNEQIENYMNQLKPSYHIKEAAKTLFFIWIGGNDYISHIDNPSNIDIFLDDPNHEIIGSNIIVEQVTNNIVMSITKLYQLGARNFIISGMPDLGKIPKIAENEHYHAYTPELRTQKLFNLSKKLTAVITLHNDILYQKLTEIRKDLQDINIINIDIDHCINKISNSINIEDSASFFDYDFNNDLALDININNQRISINNACINKLNHNNVLCNQPQRAVFWDHTHPSSYLHCLLAFHIHQNIASYNIIKPSTLYDYLTMCRSELNTLLYPSY